MLRLILILFILTPQFGFAEALHEDSRKFYLHIDDDELGDFRWGNFLVCLMTVKFPNDPGPRELNMNISRLVIVDIDNHPWIFSVKEDESSVILESITIDTHKYYTLKEKRRLFLKVVGNCDTKPIKD